jgi:hypothetical protein
MDKRTNRGRLINRVALLNEVVEQDKRGYYVKQFPNANKAAFYTFGRDLIQVGQQVGVSAKKASEAFQNLAGVGYSAPVHEPELNLEPIHEKAPKISENMPKPTWLDKLAEIKRHISRKQS